MEDNYDLRALKSDKKKRKNSKNKGNKFERDVAKILNETFNTTEFIRSPGSGAFATTHSLPDHMKMSGDLITPKNFPFIIECKKGYNKENIGSIFNPKSNLISFIEQAERDSSREKKDFLVILHQDRKEPLVIMSADNPIIAGLIAWPQLQHEIAISFKLKEKHYLILSFTKLMDQSKLIPLRSYWKY